MKQKTKPKPLKSWKEWQKTYHECDCGDYTEGCLSCARQGIKSACEFYLRYKDNPNGFFYSPYQNLIDSKEMYLLIFELVRYSVLSKLPPKKIEGIMLKLQKYNDWLFKLAFKDVLKEENDI